MLTERLLDRTPVLLLYAGTAAVWNRIPPTIVLMLYTIAVLGLTAMGYGAGLVKSRTLAPTIAVVLAFSAIMLVIQDMERPRPRLFTISQEPLVDVAPHLSRGRPEVRSCAP